MQRRHLGQQLSVLASTQGLTQVHLARRCQISRISINRFFRGRSELKAGDLMRLLQALGIDVHREIQGRIHTHLSIGGFPSAS